MSYYVLKSNCEVLSRTTVQRVTNLELQTDEVKSMIIEFDDAVRERLQAPGDAAAPDARVDPEAWRNYLREMDSDFKEEFDWVVSDDGIPEADDEFTPDIFDDTYLNIEIALPRDGIEQPVFGRVTKRMRDEHGRPIGTANDNPILDTRLYEVEYLDGHKAAMSANIIADNMFAQVDEEGNRFVLMDEITDHRRGVDAVSQQDAFITTSSGTRRRVETTKGWELLVTWKDGSTNWVSLKDIKNSYPVQAAEYAVANRIAEEPAFAWWVPHTLKKRERILAKVKSKYWVRTHKFGIRIPKSVEEAKRLDRENGNTLWWDAIVQEMKNVRPAFEEWEKGVGSIPPGFQEIKCHLIFDVKMGENFRRKARFVAGGHTTDTPASATYSSVVSRDSVRIALMVAALNGVKVMACDIQNAYLTADCREKIWTRAGPEFGSEIGKIMIVRKALYGLKSSGAAFRAHLGETLWDIGYRSTKGDPDVWVRPATKPDGHEYYEMLLVYVDDLVCCSHDPMQTMRGIQSDFKLKDDKVEAPEIYLGANLEEKVVDGQLCWTMSSTKYVKAAVANVEEALKQTGDKLPAKCPTPMTSGYRPEVDDTTELSANGLQYFQELIGVLRWACEIGRIDILTEVSMLSTHLALPREGHLKQVYHIFGYLKANPKKTIAFDPRHPVISEERFVKHDWYDFYRDAVEPVPGDLPKPRGNIVSTHCFVDADHAANRATRRSQTGMLIFVNRAPIIWYSKRQNTVETSTFGSELIALKAAVETIQALRFKLRSFGIPIEGATNIFCDNEAVTKATRTPESTLSKKHNAVAWHRVREAVAMEMVRVAKEDTKTNLADLMTKTLAYLDRERLMDRFMY